MGFSSQQYRKDHQERPWKVHPIWRGIGCFLILLVPIMSWFAAGLFLQYNTIIALPNNLTQVVAIPNTRINAIDQLIVPINQFFKASGFGLGQLLFTIFFSFIGFGILAFAYAVIYRMAGPPRYGPFDIPPNVK